MSASLETKKFALVVEDNPNDALVTKFTLQSMNYIPIHVDNGFAALEIADVYHFSIIIIDLMMPQMSGIDLMKRLRNNEKIKSIPILITSGRNEERDVKLAVSLGAKDYLVKPMDIMLFKSKVEHLTEKLTYDWFQYNFDSKHSEAKAELSFHTHLKSINEIGCTIESPVPVKEDTTFHIKSVFLQNIGIDDILVRVVSNESVSDHFELFAIFVGLTEEKKQLLRVSCHKIWIQAKQKASA